MTARPNLKKLRDAEPEKWLKTNISSILDTTEGGELTEDGKTPQNENNNEPQTYPSLTRTETR